MPGTDEREDTGWKNIDDVTRALIKLGWREESDRYQPDIHTAVGIIRSIGNSLKTPKAAKDGLRAVAALIELIERREMAEEVKGVIAEGIKEGMERGMAGVNERMGRMEDSVREAVGGAASEMKEAREEIRSMGNRGASYADAAKGILPTRLAAVIDRQDAKAKQVVVRRDRDIEEGQYSPMQLSEKELVEKANIALESIEDNDNKPAEVTFVAARKLKEGDTMLLMNTPEARQWLCAGNMDAFTAGFDAFSKARAPMLTVVAEFVPVGFNPEDQGELRMVERDAGMEKGSIETAAWIKPVQRRKMGQKHAHLKVRMVSRAQANKAIRDGIFILGKMISVRKEEHDPPMCYRCHMVGDGHFAANCTAEVELCGHCGQTHRSKECPDMETRWCHICKKAGHGAGDKTCETRRTAIERIRRSNPEAGHRYFIEKDNPETWARPGREDQEPTEVWRTEGTGGFGRRVATKVGQEKWDMTGLPTAPRGDSHQPSCRIVTTTSTTHRSDPSMTEQNHSKFGCRITQINLNKSQDAQDYLINSLQGHDIVLIQEPWVDRGGFARAIQRYRVIYPFVEEARKLESRAVILVAVEIASDHVINLQINSPDVVGIDVNCGPAGWIRIINVYNDCKHDRSLQAMDEFLTNERQRRNEAVQDQMIWAGDFNRHHPMWDETRNHHLFTPHNIAAAERLIDLTDRFGMVMRLKKDIPTLRAMNTKNYTRVDNVWCSEAIQGMFVKCDTVPEKQPPKTDHFPVVSQLAYELVKGEVRIRKNFRAADWQMFRDALEKELEQLGRPTLATTVNEFEGKRLALERAIQHVIDDDNIVPVTRPCPFTKRWWNSDLGMQRRRVGNLSREAYKKRGIANHGVHEAYRRARNKLADDIKIAKREHWRGFLEGVDNGTVFVAGRIVGGPGTDGGALRMPALRHKVGGREARVTENAEKAKIFYKLFYPPPPAQSSVPKDPEYPEPRWDFRMITDQQIETTIHRLSPYKATKPGTAPNSVFTHCADLLAPYLGQLYRATFTLEHYPAAWAETESVVIQKPGKTDYTIPNAWRPVTLSNGMARVLNATLADDLVAHAERTGALPANHFGGRPGRSTMDSIHLMTKTVMDAWRRGEVASALFLDVKGAFPSVAVDRLEHNLRMAGIPRESDPFPVENGLDQGDAMSVILYLLYNAGILATVKGNKKELGLLFIDDAAIVVTGATFTEAHARLKEIMMGDGGIFRWARDHNCEFGVDKFQLLDMSRKRVPHPMCLKKTTPLARRDLVLGAYRVVSSEQVRFLGIWLDRELRWNQQGAAALAKGRDWISRFASCTSQ
ncbi:hypothetical protein CCMSSC00406_0006763 [Pleurotus cornucopiae]|uniref:Uncharacterized protein n=2 Tax=Pleurotus cornucopiae TaxID=5321 RepID=A0ACB7J1E6_PLECO|nr:hypothetical protein CCMSSC00406_0007243 [Pleurotus cornucopiae]KAG9224095.1 hypothetical protein CCMSSC00406_0006763 [Pleurotus cornucopiae]